MNIVYIEAIIMDNDEILHFGKSLGFIGKRQRDLLNKGATKLTKGSEDIVAIKRIGEDNVA